MMRVDVGQLNGANDQQLMGWDGNSWHYRRLTHSHLDGPSPPTAGGGSDELSLACTWQLQADMGTYTFDERTGEVDLGGGDTFPVECGPLAEVELGWDADRVVAGVGLHCASV
eukprot:Skav209391  [mRNA]  locus=scaffold3334:280037:280951:- [translate_table: standard]